MTTQTNVLPREFYERDPELVARELLGKRLLRKVGGRALEGIIVETEAYYGQDDPASRAYRGMKPYNRLMWSEPGRAFIYNVHNNWLLNVIAHEPGKVGGVLIRAIEPKDGVEEMKKNREVENLLRLASGPGRLTKALAIDKSLNGVPVTSSDSEIQILDSHIEFEVGYSSRIGVRKDLDKPLRFYIKGNKFVSTRQT
jgi:DNA-3-methyladenine glycosylase